MKYMGSKAAMLDQGLESLLAKELVGRSRFVDLFAGSGVVAKRVAATYPIAVTAVDTQNYSRHLSAAVIERTKVVLESGYEAWIQEAKDTHAAKRSRVSLSALSPNTEAGVAEQRLLSAEAPDADFVTRSYGGHYFSLEQALALDSLIQAMQGHVIPREFMMAAILEAASSAAAAPGHTAQPFQPTDQLLPHIASAWGRDVFTLASSYCERSASVVAKISGRAVTDDAQSYTSSLQEGDLVFCDPPYSEAQYSRFYHVLEGIAVGGWDSIEGNGRAPKLQNRYRSDFSSRKSSGDAFDELFESIRARGARVVLTFPNHECSNGQSADSISERASVWFEVERQTMTVSHSSLGGATATKSTSTRHARRAVEEAVLILRPR